jgi:hypothetical protein
MAFPVTNLPHADPPPWLGTMQPKHGELWNALMGFREALLAGAGEFPCFKSPPLPEAKSGGDDPGSVGDSTTGNTLVGGELPGRKFDGRR